MAEHERISIDPAVCHGRPVIKGANIPRAAMKVLHRQGHIAEHVRDIGLGDASDDRIAAQAEGAVLVTRDLDFADVRRYPPVDGPGFLVLRVPEHLTADHIATLLERFVSMTNLVSQIPGHLVVLDENRARFRPALYP